MRSAYIALALSALVTMPATGEAQTPSTPNVELSSSGTWIAITGPFVLADDTPHKTSIFDGSFCHASTERETPNFSILDIIHLNDRGDIVIQIGSDQWNYHWFIQDVSIQSGTISMELKSAHYAGGHIEIVLTGKIAGYAEATLEAMSKHGGPTIDVLDYRRKKVASFSSSGMKRILAKAKSCARTNP